MATEDTRDPQVIDPGVRWQRLVLGAAGATLVIVVYTLLNRWNAARFPRRSIPPWWCCLRQGH